MNEEEFVHQLGYLAGYTEEEVNGLAKAIRALAERAGASLEAAAEAIMREIQQKPDVIREKEKNGEFLDIVTVWDRKEAREKRRAVERAIAHHFRQYNGRENAWNTKKRTGQRQREWRGPWKEN